MMWKKSQNVRSVQDVFALLYLCWLDRLKESLGTSVTLMR